MEPLAFSDEPMRSPVDPGSDTSSSGNAPVTGHSGGQQVRHDQHHNEQRSNEEVHDNASPQASAASTPKAGDTMHETGANSYDKLKPEVRISMARGLASTLQEDEKELASARIRFQVAEDKFERYKTKYQAASMEYHSASTAFVDANKAVESIQESLEPLKISLFKDGWQLTARGWTKNASATPEPHSTLSSNKRLRKSSPTKSPKDVQTPGPERYLP